MGYSSSYSLFSLWLVPGGGVEVSYHNVMLFQSSFNKILKTHLARMVHSWRIVIFLV